MLKSFWAWSCVWSMFSPHRGFNRTQDTKRFTVPFTRFGRDNKSVSVCVPAIVYTCAHMSVCVRVCATIAVQMCLRDSSLFTSRCSWCLASGPCHDPWHCHWLTSRTHCARRAPSRFFSLHPLPPFIFPPFSCLHLFFLSPLYTHAHIYKLNSCIASVFKFHFFPSS